MLSALVIDRPWATLNGVIWILAAVVLGLVVAAWLGVRRYICFRRRDCCGKGCGCLFPVNRGRR
jgi:hypothetical protein